MIVQKSRQKCIYNLNFFCHETKCVMTLEIGQRLKVRINMYQYVYIIIPTAHFFKSFDTTTQKRDNIIPLPIRHAQQRRYFSLKIQYRWFLAEKKYKDRFL